MEHEAYDGAEIEFQGRGIKTLKASCYLKVADPGTRIVLIISDTDEKLSHLASLQNVGGIPEELQATNVPPGSPGYPGSTNPNPNRNMVRPLGTASEWIPDRWIGFDSVDTLVLQDFPHTSLKPPQIPTLRGYAASGGTMLVIGGANWQRLAQSPLADLWPITPRASDAATPSEVRILVKRHIATARPSPADRLGGAAVVVTRGDLRSGARRLIGSAAFPLLTASNVGAGHVLFLAVDPTKPPFIGWNGNTSIWVKDIFNSTTRPQRLQGIGAGFGMAGYPYPGSYSNRGYPGYGGAEGPTGAVVQALGQVPQLRTPPVSYIVWFLALYVFFLVPVNYCVLRYFDKRELAWVTIPIIVLGFSVMSYAAALRIKGSAILTRHINIVQGTANSGVARADALFWLFSPRKTTYDISSSDPQMIVGDYIASAQDANSAVAIREPAADSSFVIEDAAINMWDWRTFVGHSVANLGEGVRVTEAGSRSTVQNNLKINNEPVDLRGVVLVSGYRIYEYGDLKAGTTKKSPVASDGINYQGPQIMGGILTASKIGEIFSGSELGTTSAMAQSILTAALGPQFGKTDPGALLIGWGNRPASALTIGEGAPPGQDVTLFIFRLRNPAPTRVFRGQATSRRPGLGGPGAISRAKIAAHLAQVQARGKMLPLDPVGKRTMVINGDLAEWGSLSVRSSRIAQQANYLAGQLRPGQNDRAVIKLLRDKQALYVAARVVDASVYNPYNRKDWWQGDCVEVFLDVRPLASGKIPVGVPVGRNWGIHGTPTALTNCFQAADAGWEALPVEAGDQAVRQIGNIKAAGRLMPDGYTVEIRIPFKSLTNASAKRFSQPIGFEVMVDDTDAVGPKNQYTYTPLQVYSWGGLSDCYQDASKFACARSGY